MLATVVITNSNHMVVQTCTSRCGPSRRADTDPDAVVERLQDADVRRRCDRGHNIEGAEKSTRNREHGEEGKTHDIDGQMEHIDRHFD